MRVLAGQCSWSECCSRTFIWLGLGLICRKSVSYRFKSYILYQRQWKEKTVGRRRQAAEALEEGSHLVVEVCKGKNRNRDWGGPGNGCGTMASGRTEKGQGAPWEKEGRTESQSECCRVRQDTSGHIQKIKAKGPFWRTYCLLLNVLKWNYFNMAVPFTSNHAYYLLAYWYIYSPSPAWYLSIQPKPATTPVFTENKRLALNKVISVSK